MCLEGFCSYYKSFHTYKRVSPLFVCLLVLSLLSLSLFKGKITINLSVIWHLRFGLKWKFTFMNLIFLLFKITYVRFFFYFFFYSLLNTFIRPWKLFLITDSLSSWHPKNHLKFLSSLQTRPFCPIHQSFVIFSPQSPMFDLTYSFCTGNQTNHPINSGPK